MNSMISAYESKLRSGADRLERLERSGRTDQRYQTILRRWLELLAAYEYECEMVESASGVLAAAI